MKQKSRTKADIYDTPVKAARKSQARACRTRPEAMENRKSDRSACDSVRIDKKIYIKTTDKDFIALRCWIKLVGWNHLRQLITQRSQTVLRCLYKGAWLSASKCCGSSVLNLSQ